MGVENNLDLEVIQEMQRRRKIPTIEASDSDDEPLSKKVLKISAAKDEDSSSDSDIGDYLQSADKIDFSSSFFDVEKARNAPGPSRLVDSNESEADEGPGESTNLDFAFLNDYSKKLEDTKRQIEEYNARKEKQIDCNIEALLAIGELKPQLEQPLSNDSETDWEDVEEKKEKKKKRRKEKPKTEGLEIIVEMPTVVKKKKGVDFLLAVKRRINRVRKDNQVLIHKVHLLCWIAHGNYINRVLNSHNILSRAISLLPSEKSYPKDRPDLQYLESIVKWYSNTIKVSEQIKAEEGDLREILENQIENKTVPDQKSFVYIFITILRSLGIECRLVLSLQVETLRPPSEELHSLSAKVDKKQASRGTKKSNSSLKVGDSKKDKVKKPKSKASNKLESNSNNNKEQKTKAEDDSKNQPTAPKCKAIISKKGGKTIKEKTAKSNNTEKTKVSTRSQKKQIPQLDGNDDSDIPPKCNLKKLRGVRSVKKYKDSTTDEDEAVKPRPNLKKLKETKTTDVRDDVKKLVKGRIKEERKKRRKRSDGEDSDYMEESPPKRRNSADDFMPKKNVKQRLEVKVDDDDGKKKRAGMDVWLEVFLAAEEKWISVDIYKGKIHCVKDLFSRASHPVSYILAWDNNNRIKDVTKRYCVNFNTITRKLRIDTKWWEETLVPYLAPKNAKDKAEDEDFERQQLDQPLPKSIAEYKNHPLYVLKRHLLKFEALYPPDAPTLGFVRNEAVYSRQCVHTLHSRDIWMKHARIVKVKQEPYKIVKARPKWDKLSNQVITDQNLEIFGIWQTEDYDPPTAENGIVPRNAFGNVELFKPCMLPKKTVHLQRLLLVPGLNKVARKLRIDCASAVTGFDFHGGWNHPVYDGFVVCEEFKDTLVAAWEKEQEDIIRKEEEKVDKRVYGNWRKLIRGLLIRERLQNKYEFGQSSKEGKKPNINRKKIESDSD